MVNWKNKEEVKRYHAMHSRKWYHKNREKCTKRMKRYRETHGDYFKRHNELYKDKKKEWHIKHRKEVIERMKKWIKDNPERYAELSRQKTKRYHKKYPEKSKAQQYAKKHHQKENECIVCNSKDNLVFHHIDYKNNKGVTLCRKCHQEIHKGD